MARYYHENPSVTINYRNKNRTLSYDRVAAMKERAVRFTINVLDDPDRAAEIEAESVHEYARRKKIFIENPDKRGWIPPMQETMSKAELVDALDEVEEILDDALDPKLTREEVVGKLEEAYELVAGEDESEDQDVDEEDEE